MLNRIMTLLAVCVLLTQITMAKKDTSEDKKFEALANKYISELIEMNPEWATSLGEHKYDGRLNDYSLNGVKNERKFTEKYLKELGKIKPEKLSQVNNVDYRIMKHNLDYNIFQIDVLRSYEWNPMSYNVGGAINDLISRDFAP